MKLIYGKQAYDSLSPESRASLTPVRCRCVACDGPDPECTSCDGYGTVYEDRSIHPDDMRAILDNLRSQGVPIPKDEGTQ